MSIPARILAGLVVALACAFGGFRYGVHVTRQAWDLADAKARVKQQAADLKEGAKIHATDLDTSFYLRRDVVDLVTLRLQVRRDIEESNHAIDSTPALGHVQLPATLVRLRKHQADQSAAIAAAAARALSGDHAAVQGTDP